MGAGTLEGGDMINGATNSTTEAQPPSTQPLLMARILYIFLIRFENAKHMLESIGRNFSHKIKLTESTFSMFKYNMWCLVFCPFAEQ